MRHVLNTNFLLAILLQPELKQQLLALNLVMKELPEEATIDNDRGKSRRARHDDIDLKYIHLKVLLIWLLVVKTLVD